MKVNRNSFITVTREDSTEDDFGFLTGTGAITVATFFAKVKGMASTTGKGSLDANRKYETKRIKLIARTSDITGIDVDDELTVAGDTTFWQINNVSEIDFSTGNTNYSEIIAEENQ